MFIHQNVPFFGLPHGQQDWGVDLNNLSTLTSVLVDRFFRIACLKAKTACLNLR